MFDPIAPSEGARPGWPAVPNPAAQSFREYLEARRYDYGRGSAAAWAFIAFARGDRELPDVRAWRELNEYLVDVAARLELIDGARTAWRSFNAHRSHARRRRNKGSLGE